MHQVAISVITRNASIFLKLKILHNPPKLYLFKRANSTVHQSGPLEWA